MLAPNLSRLSGAALFASLFAANPALAERESGRPPAGFGEQAVDSACAESDDAAESPMCEGGRLRWRLCEQGIRSEHLAHAEVFSCFLRSL